MCEELILSPSDPAWHERRRQTVGASEVGLLFGLPSFGKRTVSDLWYEKKFGTEATSKGNASTDLGHRLEPIVLDMAEERLSTKIVDRQRFIVSGPNAATLDGRAESDGAIVDAKTSGILWKAPDEWGDDGSDDIPDSYLVQVQSQLLVTGAELAYLAALIGGRGFAMFTIQPHPTLQTAIRQKAEEFVASLASDVPPAEPPQLETLKRLRRDPGSVLPRSDLMDELQLRLEELKANAKAADAEVDTVQRQLLALLGNAEAAECNGGMVTYKQQTRKAYLAAESTFRVLRFKKGK